MMQADVSSKLPAYLKREFDDKINLCDHYSRVLTPSLMNGTDAVKYSLLSGSAVSIYSSEKAYFVLSRIKKKVPSRKFF